MQGSINTALVPKSHACRKALGSKEHLVQTTNFVSAIDQVSYNRGPGMLKKKSINNKKTVKVSLSTGNAIKQGKLYSFEH